MQVHMAKPQNDDNGQGTDDPLTKDSFSVSLPLQLIKIYATHLFISTEFSSGYVGPSMGQSDIQSFQEQVEGANHVHLRFLFLAPPLCILTSYFQRCHLYSAARRISGAQKLHFLCSTALLQPILLKIILFQSLYNFLQQLFSLQNWSPGSSYSPGYDQTRPKKLFFRDWRRNWAPKIRDFFQDHLTCPISSNKKQSFNFIHPLTRQKGITAIYGPN